MPRLDRTGPDGKGSRSGRGLGRCQKDGAQTGQLGQGQGMGRNNGGKGAGRGLRRRAGMKPVDSGE